MTSKPPPSSRPTTATGGPATANVRRNLFHHSLSRRPTTSSSSKPSTNSDPPAIHDDSADIVVKDRNGNYQVTVPTLPPMDEEGMGEQEVEGGGGEKEKMEARLLEMLRNRSVQAGEPLVPELLAAVQASLRRKVASLDEDNWMFEDEHGTPDG